MTKAQVKQFAALRAEARGLRRALVRIEAMAVRPACICGAPTGTLAIQACARKALRIKQESAPDNCKSMKEHRW